MISPQLAQLGLRWMAFIVVVSVLLLLFVRPGSAQFVVVVLMLSIGLLLGAVIVILARVKRR